MTENDKPQFFELLSGVYAFYRQAFSTLHAGIWWNALRFHDLAAINDAIGRHCMNPDNGQFCPKPADVVRMMHGTSKDGALLAWSQVDRHVRQTGIYASVKFLDCIIQRVIYDMGGWIKMCSCPSEEDWVFVGKEFENRYRGYAASGVTPECPDHLIGMAESQNVQNGMPVAPPVVIGDPRHEQLGFSEKTPARGTEIMELL